MLYFIFANNNQGINIKNKTLVLQTKTNNKTIRVLILTNHMANISGSEIVALEVAESFMQLNCEVVLCANYINSPMKEVVKASNIPLVLSSLEINPFDFDIIWSQHHVLSILIAKNINTATTKPLIVYAHLSPYALIELPGPFIEMLLSDKILANSAETADKLYELGMEKQKISVFHNAVTDSFFKNTKVLELKKILLVSNHPPLELLDAMQILSQKYNITISHIGIDGLYKRLEDQDIENHDAIISIGKTVQYSIVGLRPVYCYDHFGGPGWITKENYELAEKFNYSGRCTNIKKTSDEIVQDILTGFNRANDDISYIKESVQNRYLLKNYIQEILKAYKEYSPNISFDDNQISLIKRESCLAENIRDLYVDNFPLPKPKPKPKKSIKRFLKIAYWKSKITKTMDTK